MARVEAVKKPTGHAESEHIQNGCYDCLITISSDLREYPADTLLDRAIGSLSVQGKSIGLGITYYVLDWIGRDNKDFQVNSGVICQ